LEIFYSFNGRICFRGIDIKFKKEYNNCKVNLYYGGIIISAEDEFKKVDAEIASIAISSLSFLAAYFLVSLVKFLWKVDTLGKATMFVIGVFLIANIINYKALPLIPKPGPIEVLASRRMIMLSMLTIAVLTMVVGLVMAATILE